MFYLLHFEKVHVIIPLLLVEKRLKSVFKIVIGWRCHKWQSAKSAERALLLVVTYLTLTEKQTELGRLTSVR